MTLEQWAAKYKVHVADHDSGCKVVHYADKNTEMFDLSDYVVSSHVAGVYWLRRR